MNQSGVRRCLVHIGLFVLLCGLGQGTPALLRADDSPVKAVAALPTFELSYPKSLRTEPYTGKVILMFSEKNPTPRTGPNWFQLEPMMSVEVVDWPPDTPITISLHAPHAKFFPQPWDPEQVRGMYVQAIGLFNSHVNGWGRGEGNAFSWTAAVPKNDEAGPATVSLALTDAVPPPPTPWKAWQKTVELRSEKLSKFHGRDILHRATVILPQDYDKNSDRRYPTVWIIPGFGGDHLNGLPREQPGPEPTTDVSFIQILLNPNCPLGHHVFTDSANNGPHGTAFIEEFIPEIERRFRCDARREARFVTGHSSGGWGSLSVMLHFPETFAGTWSTAPDPVDFHDFQRINLYHPGENMYRTESGERRPLARRDGKIMAWYDDFAHMEDVLGPGGQLASFEAVFSPKMADGQPRPLWNRETGAVDPATAESWKPYDLTLKLQTEWLVREKLWKGRLHVFMGEEDTFYLEGATRRLKEVLATLDSTSTVEMVPGKDHGTLMTAERRAQLRREMAEHYRSHESAGAVPAGVSPAAP